MLARFGIKSPPRVQLPSRLQAQGYRVLCRPHLQALARLGTTKSSAALTSFGVRGSQPRPPALPTLPTPPALLRCFCRCSLAAPKVCLQLTRCVWRGGLPRPLSAVLASKVGSARGPSRHRRAQDQSCRLTCRSTGAPTAGHLAREALAVYPAPRGQGVQPSSPGYLYVRPAMTKVVHYLNTARPRGLASAMPLGPVPWSGLRHCWPRTDRHPHHDLSAARDLLVTHRHLFTRSARRPNQSLNRTRHGMPARAGLRHSVHHRSPALAGTPRRAA